MEDIKSKIKEIETTQIEHKIFFTEMKATDDAIFEKLRNITKSLIEHKNNFIDHDKSEMEKYGNIEKRLLKIERVIYMGMSVLVTIEFLSKMHLLNFG